MLLLLQPPDSNFEANYASFPARFVHDTFKTTSRSQVTIFLLWRNHFPRVLVGINLKGYVFAMQTPNRTRWMSNDLQRKLSTHVAAALLFFFFGIKASQFMSTSNDRSSAIEWSRAIKYRCQVRRFCVLKQLIFATAHAVKPIKI